MFSIDSITHGDCLELMKEISDGAIDMICCDLPYGVLNKGNRHSQWDTPIDLGLLWEQYDRVIKPNGAIVLFGQGMFTCKLMMSRPDLWKYNLIWEKGRVTGFLNAKTQPLRCHEDICVFYKSQPTYNPQMEKCPSHLRNHSQGRGPNHQRTNRCYGALRNTNVSEISDEKFPRSIISFPAAHKTGSFFHPTQKPEKLLEYLILTYTNPGEVVLDNCIGSGTTALAAIRTGRHYIGYEITKEYFDIAAKRVSEEMKQTRLDLF